MRNTEKAKDDSGPIRPKINDNECAIFKPIKEESFYYVEVDEEGEEEMSE